MVGELSHRPLLSDFQKVRFRFIKLSRPETAIGQLVNNGFCQRDVAGFLLNVVQDIGCAGEIPQRFQRETFPVSGRHGLLWIGFCCVKLSERF